MDFMKTALKGVKFWAENKFTKIEKDLEKYANSKIDEDKLPNTIPSVQSATVGQAVVVKSVDENGAPTEWKVSSIITEHQDLSNYALKTEVPVIDTSTPIIHSATIGQTIVVKNVDENGKPTEWETKDMSNANIIYSESEPTGETGMIWLKPV